MLHGVSGIKKTQEDMGRFGKLIPGYMSSNISLREIMQKGSAWVVSEYLCQTPDSFCSNGRNLKKSRKKNLNFAA